MSAPLIPLLDRGALVHRPKEAWLAWDIQDVLNGLTEIDLDDRFLCAEHCWQRPIELSWLLREVLKNLNIEPSSAEGEKCLKPFLDRLKGPENYKHDYKDQVQQLRGILAGLALPTS